MLKRGDIVLVDLGDAPDEAEQQTSRMKGRRPALVIQNNKQNKHATTTIILTMSTKPRAPHLAVKVTPEESGMDKDSYINVTNVISIDQNDIIKKIGKVRFGTEEMGRLNDALKVQLGLDGD
jgi:mRNA interferase MazF